MNKQLYDEKMNKYLELLKDYKTNEEKIEFLEDIEFNIKMIDRWSEEDKVCIDVISNLLHQLKED